MVITTNHPPKMMEVLESRQLEVNAGCGTNKFFYLQTTANTFGLRALRTLVQKAKVEVIPTGTGDVLCRLAHKLG